METTAKPVVYEFLDYKRYLRAWVESRPNGGRGAKSKMAEQARCHLAYISQVLTGNSHFNLEQADALNGILEHGEDEAQFFLLLVEHARAGTHSLKKRFDRRIQTVLNQRTQLKNRFTDKKALAREHQAIYYSHWAYAAVHIGVTIPKLRSVTEIARYFDFAPSKAVEILEFLCSVGLVKNDARGYLPGDVRLHLEHDSPMISKHHSNWRLQAMQSFEHEKAHELHYSGVVSVSHEDLPKIREIMIRTLEQVRAIVKESSEETLYCYALDLFGLGRD